MAWSTVSAATVKPRLTATELTALQTLDLPSGITDALADLITQVVDEVRGYIQSGGNNLGAAGTLPSRLVSAAITIVRYRLATRLPIGVTMTDARRREYEDAMKLLDRVANGGFAIEEPTTADTESAGGAGPSIEGKTLTHDRTSQDGL